MRITSACKQCDRFLKVLTKLPIQSRFQPMFSIGIRLLMKSLVFLIFICAKKSSRSKLQLHSESNSGKIFLASDWDFWKLGKKEDILDWEWGLLSAPGDREKRPCEHTYI